MLKDNGMHNRFKYCSQYAIQPEPLSHFLSLDPFPYKSHKICLIQIEMPATFN